MKWFVTTLIVMSSSLAFATSPSHGSAPKNTPAATAAAPATTTAPTKATKMVDCKDAKNKEHAECKKVTH